MGRLELAGLALGAALLIVCAALVFWPAAFGVAGVLSIAASWPRGER